MNSKAGSSAEGWKAQAWASMDNSLGSTIERGDTLAQSRRERTASAGALAGACIAGMRPVTGRGEQR